MKRYLLAFTTFASLGLLTLLALPHLSLATEITIGTGTGTQVIPMRTSYDDNRTQAIYLASEIGMPGPIIALAVNVYSIPGQVMNNFTIRLKHTTLSQYPGSPIWESTDWTVVYQSNVSVTSTGWYIFTFTTPFDYNGTDSLMVDWSFNNSSHTPTAGYCYHTSQSVTRTIYQYTNGSYGDPLTWANRTPVPMTTLNRPDIKIWIGTFDIDGDGLPDSWENQYSCMMADTVDNLVDYDSDGLNNQSEYSYDTNPCLDDTDGDGMLDGWEALYAYCGLNPLLDDSLADQDGDSFTNLFEFQHSMDPCFSDTDNDGDGLSDADETTIYFTNPNNPDTDGDGVKDGAEVSAGSNPLSNLIVPRAELVGDCIHSITNYYEWVPAWSGAGFKLFVSVLGDFANTINTINITLDGNTYYDDWGFWYSIFSDGGSYSYQSFFNLDLVWTGSEYGAVVRVYNQYYKNRTIKFARVNTSGQRIGNEIILGQGSHPSLVWTGSEYGAVMDYDLNSINFARVSAAGTQIGATLPITPSTGGNILPSLVWTGSEYALAWQSNRDGNNEIYFTRLAPDGDTIGLNLRLTSNPGESLQPALSWTGSSFGLAWSDDRDGNLEIYFARISPSGVRIGPDRRVTAAANASEYPDLVWTGLGFALGWFDQRNGNEVYFAVLDHNGMHITGELLIGDNSYPASLDHSWPRLAWSGGIVGVAWGDGDLKFQRVRFDSDGDGLYPDDEAAAGTNPADWDTDDDGMGDGWEVSFSACMNSLIADSPSADYDGDGLSNLAEFNANTNPCAADTDGDGMPDGWEVAQGFNPLVNDAAADADADGLSNLGEYQAGTNPHNPDTDGDGVTDGAEMGAGLNPLLWDTDGDALPDGYEVAHVGSSPGLDALNSLDGAANFDADSNANANEYWNGSDPWTKNPVGAAGCFYWGDAGMGDGIVSPTDAIELKKALSGAVGNYSGVIPNNGETHELDMDGYISPLDLIILQKMIQGSAIGPMGSRPTALVTTDAPGATVNVGFTTHVIVSVRNEAAKGTPGIGVIFEIVPASSTATATLLGGDGRGAGAPTGTRYDISGPITPGGLSRIVLRMDSAGTLTLRARVPACGLPGIGRSSPEITLDPAAVVHGE